MKEKKVWGDIVKEKLEKNRKRDVSNRSNERKIVKRREKKKKWREGVVGVELLHRYTNSFDK